MKKIAVGDLGEFWYGDYKEPFVQLEGGVPGHPQGVVLRADDGKILCAFCGKTFDMLGSHIQAKHGLSARAYKEEVGLLQKTALMSESRRLGAISGGSAERIRRMRAALPARDWRTGRKGNGLRAAEYQNKTGRCYAQLLAVGRQIMREQGRVTIASLSRIGIWQGTIEDRFGSLERFRQLVGDGGRDHRAGWTNDELLTALSALAKKLGRTPAGSDIRRYGLPEADTYRRRFGSYPEACLRAGLSPYRRPASPESDASVLLAYAATGQVGLAAVATHRGPTHVRRVLVRYGVPLFPPGGANHVARSEARRFAAEVAQRLEGVAA